VQFEAVALASHVPDITALNVKQAAQAIADTQDVLDVRVMLAQENASPTKRTTIIKALEKRMGELTDGGQA
jgi:hypothetical protein